MKKKHARRRHQRLGPSGHRDDRKQVAAAESFVSKGHGCLRWFSWKRHGFCGCVRADSRDQTAIDMLLHHEILPSKSDSVAAALEQYRNRPALGFSDCLILETARKAGHLPLGTFDEISPNSREPKDYSSALLGPSESSLSPKIPQRSRLSFG